MSKKKKKLVDWFVETLDVKKEIECEVIVRCIRGKLQITVKEAT